MKEYEIKARALILSFQLLVKDFQVAKQCALIAVNEITEALDSDRIIYGSLYRNEESEYWNMVKQSMTEA